ncbi:MAG: hypothetical protein ABFQ62_05145 [Patescibacteria group bacterium]
MPLTKEEAERIVAQGFGDFLQFFKGHDAIRPHLLAAIDMAADDKYQPIPDELTGEVVF